MQAGEVYVGRPGQKNRPSILKSDGETIKEKEAREVYGFKSFVVYESPIKTNVCSVEDALQNFLQHKFIDNCWKYSFFRTLYPVSLRRWISFGC